MTGLRPDLSVVIVSHGDQRWLPACLRSLATHADGLRVEVIVVENGPGPAAAVSGPPHVQVTNVVVENRGFGAANNEGIRRAGADAVLLLNPDTEIRGGSLRQAVDLLRTRPGVGCLAVIQVGDDGALYPSIRRRPSVARALAAAFGCERWPLVGALAGERELRAERYWRETECDWTTGAVMLLRREALDSVGGFDERFFMFSEETDLCHRLRHAGWRVVHSPVLTVCHFVGRAGIQPRRAAQMIYARQQFADKHFGRPRAAAHRCVLLLDRALRAALLHGRPPTATMSAEAAEAGLRALLGRQAPFPLSPRG